MLSVVNLSMILLKLPALVRKTSAIMTGIILVIRI